MMENFRAWYLRNQIQITWFLIGLLFYSGLIQFGQGDYAGMLLSWGIAVINYMFVKK
jgi:uncharacterized protein (DUF486 family)